jgi:hypothetical protein
VILPDPAFTAPPTPLCLTDAAVTLVPTGTTGGTFSGPGVVGDLFDPALAGYWGDADPVKAMETAIAIINAHAAKVDGVKISLLDKDKAPRLDMLQISCSAEVNLKWLFDLSNRSGATVNLSLRSVVCDEATRKPVVAWLEESIYGGKMVCDTRSSPAFEAIVSEARAGVRARRRAIRGAPWGARR